MSLKEEIEKIEREEVAITEEQLKYQEDEYNKEERIKRIKSIIRIQKSRLEMIRKHKERVRKTIEEENRRNWLWRRLYATNLREWYPWSWERDEKDANSFIEQLETELVGIPRK